MQTTNTCAACARPGAELCPHCGAAAFCADCVQGRAPQWEQHRQLICFSITAPGAPLERAVSNTVGGLGAVHQYVTQLALSRPFEEDEAPGAQLAPDEMRLLVAGVIWNDFPTGEEQSGPRYLAQLLEPIGGCDAPYLTDARFRLQPTLQTRWAMATVYKKAPDALARLGGVTSSALAVARLMVAERDQPARSHYHFMRATAAEPDRSVVARAAATAVRWYHSALVAPAEQGGGAFALGHLVHMVEDSFSPAHTLRRAPAAPDAPYPIERVYYFGDQSEKSHSRQEGWSAVCRPGSEGDVRVQGCARAVRRLVARFLADRARLRAALADADAADPDPARLRSLIEADQALHVAEAMRDAVLLPHIFALASADPERIEADCLPPPRTIAVFRMATRGVGPRENAMTVTDHNAVIDIVVRGRGRPPLWLGEQARARLAELRAAYGHVELEGRGGGCTRASTPSIEFRGDGARLDDSDGELRAFMSALWQSVAAPNVHP